MTSSGLTASSSSSEPFFKTRKSHQRRLFLKRFSGFRKPYFPQIFLHAIRQATAAAIAASALERYSCCTSDTGKV